MSGPEAPKYEDGKNPEQQKSIEQGAYGVAFQDCKDVGSKDLPPKTQQEVNTINTKMNGGFGQLSEAEFDGINNGTNIGRVDGIQGSGITQVSEGTIDMPTNKQTSSLETTGEGSSTESLNPEGGSDVSSSGVLPVEQVSNNIKVISEAPAQTPDMVEALKSLTKHLVAGGDLNGIQLSEKIQTDIQRMKDGQNINRPMFYKSLATIIKSGQNNS